MALTRDPEYYERKRLAYAAFYKALRTSVLQRPAACETCRADRWRVEGHHRWGYAPENALRVVWLCGGCHAAEHDAARANYRSIHSKLWRERRMAGVPITPDEQRIVAALAYDALDAFTLTESAA